MFSSKCEQINDTLESKKRKRCDFTFQLKDELASIYAYCLPINETPTNNNDIVMYDSKIHGTVVYVGQTIQNIKTRDRAHLSHCSTQFDKMYTKNGQYALVLIAQKQFIISTSKSDTYMNLVSEWLDYNEKHYIEKFDTYRNGMNCTRGGQGQSWLITMKEAIAKQTYIRFKDVYMPLFEKCYVKYGNINIKHRSVEYNILGQLICNIRCGVTTIPLEFKDKLKNMGLCIELHGLYRQMWLNNYMPIFEEYHNKYGHINVSIYDSDYGDNIGKLLNRIRTGITTIPEEHEEQLYIWGLDTRNQKIVQRDYKWENVIMPNFRSFHQEFKHVNVPRDYKDFGPLVDHIRSGHTTIPLHHKPEMLDLGFTFSSRNIAYHIRMVLDRPPGNPLTDIETMNVLSTTLEHHNKLILMRSNKNRKELFEHFLMLIPFGNKPIGNGIDRLMKDIKC